MVELSSPSRSQFAYLASQWLPWAVLLIILFTFLGVDSSKMSYLQSSVVLLEA